MSARGAGSMTVIRVGWPPSAAAARAKKRVEQAKGLLDAIGIGGNRVRMCNLSSSDGPLFAKYAEEMHDRICAAGPNPIKLAAQKRSTAEAGSKLAAPS